MMREGWNVRGIFGCLEGVKSVGRKVGVRVWMLVVMVVGSLVGGMIL
jgi:hypothetical protein